MGGMSKEKKEDLKCDLYMHIFIIRLTHANLWESIGKPCSCTQFIKSCILHYKSCKNPYQVLQVICVMSERAMK